MSFSIKFLWLNFFSAPEPPFQRGSSEPCSYRMGLSKRFGDGDGRVPSSILVASKPSRSNVWITTLASERRHSRESECFTNIMMFREFWLSNYGAFLRIEACVHKDDRSVPVCSSRGPSAQLHFEHSSSWVIHAKCQDKFIFFLVRNDRPNSK